MDVPSFTHHNSPVLDIRVSTLELVRIKPLRTFVGKSLCEQMFYFSWENTEEGDSFTLKEIEILFPEVTVPFIFPPAKQGISSGSMFSPTHSFVNVFRSLVILVDV